MNDCTMQTRFTQHYPDSGTPASGPHAPLRTALVTTCAGIMFMLLAACDGSSGSETVSGSDPVADNGAASQPPTGAGTSYNLGNTPQAVIEQCMSDTDKEILTQVNAARAQGRACGSVNYPAAAALRWHCTLEDVAFAHSRDMGDHNFFSHTGSDGLAVGDRLSNAGYDWTEVGENIAAGQPTVTAVMSAWLDSPGHCANIMRASYTETGAASYFVTGSDYPVYWTQVFARPR